MSRNNRPLFGMESNGVNRLPGTPKLDPFKNPRVNPLDPVIPTDPEIVRRVRETYNDPVPVIQPRHIQAPEGARTINLLKILVVAPATRVDLFEFVCKPGSTTVFYRYELIIDALVAAPGVLWHPTIDGKRILQYHGEPAVNGVFAMNSPTDVVSLGFCGPPVECQVLMEPGQSMKWEVQNLTGAPVAMGVRMNGYLDMSQRLTSTKFGD